MDDVSVSAEGTYLVDGTVLSARTVLENARQIVESYNDVYGSLFHVGPETRILDIGCGMGHFLIYARQRGARHLRAMDLGAKQVELCRELGFDAECIRDLPSALRPHAGTFDVVHMSHVIEHLPLRELDSILKAVRASLSEGGVLVVRTPNMSHWLGSHMRYLDFTHVTGFTAWSLKQALWQGGFRSVEVRGVAPRFHWRPRRIAWLVAHRLLEAIVRLLAHVELPSDRPQIMTAELVAVARSR
jgi:2-polyprenyl-3-methyl-5-hydroxy-6-metoxy-1,4-benzoquinol methylase